MVSISNQIEEYFKRLLAASGSNMLEIKRSDVAEIFMCTPSQINYVLETRFRPEMGFHVETRRGGGGYVRIIKLQPTTEEDLLQLMDSTINRPTGRVTAEKLVERLVDEDFITAREGLIVKAMLDGANLNLPQESSGVLRSHLLRSLLICLLRDDF